MEGVIMQVNGNTLSFNTWNINNNKDQEEKQINNISRAEKEFSADPSSAIIAQFLQGDISVLTQGVENGNDAISVLQIAGGALNQLSENTARLQELSVANNSAALNADQKAALQSEFSAIQSAMSDTMTQAQFNGQQLFGKNLEFSLGSSSVAVSLSNMTPQNATIDSQESISALSDVISNNLINSGAAVNQVSSSLNALVTEIEAQSAARSQLSDVDMAQAVTQQKEDDTKLNAAIIAQSHNTDMLRSTMQHLLG